MFEWLTNFFNRSPAAGEERMPMPEITTQASATPPVSSGGTPPPVGADVKTILEEV